MTKIFVAGLRVFVICLAFLTSDIAAAWAAEQLSKKYPGPQQGENFKECVDKLMFRDGGWCEIRLSGTDPSISSVWPVNPDQKIRMATGPSAVLEAWNGAAFDGENRIFYFFGGGHTDYGGNEIYAYRLDNASWTRLTDPSPLDHLFIYDPASQPGKKSYCWAPDMRRVPSATQTYDGIQFSRKSKTIFVAVQGAARSGCMASKEFPIDENTAYRYADSRAVYEFNPSSSNTNNGLRPLTWRRLKGIRNFRQPRMVELDNGRLLIGDPNALFEFDPVSGKLGRQVFRERNRGSGLAKYHPDGKLLLVSSQVMKILNLKTGAAKLIPMPQRHGKSLAVSKDGTVVSWDGFNQILTLNIRQEPSQWTMYDWRGAGPLIGAGRVFSKWQLIEKSDVFVGLSSHKTGVWVYKHPKIGHGTRLSNINLQAILKKAGKGDIVTLPPGNYGRSLVVNKSLTVRMAGVNLLGVARNRAILNIKCHGCDITIEDFKVDGRRAGCISGNCAAIKAEGKNFKLTIRRAHIDNSVLGILTDNRGGVLRILDSVIENTGLRDNSTTLGHGVYAGRIDKLVITNSIIRSVYSDGHLLKSRAKNTILDRVQLLGLKGFHSRTIDLPCGGYLSLKNSVLRHGANTDNADLIAIGTEPRGCGSIAPGNVSITNTTIIFDRDHSPDERARHRGPNTLFTWRAPYAKLVVINNVIVNLEKWSLGGGKNKDIPDFSALNRMCKTVKACGIK